MGRAGGHVRDPQETWGASGEAVTGGYTHVPLAECRGQGKAERQTEMTTVSRQGMTVAWTQENTGRVARAGKSPGSIFLSQNQSQAVGHWTFPGTAKQPASSLESALDPPSLEQTKLLQCPYLSPTVVCNLSHSLCPCLLLGCFPVSWSEADVTAGRTSASPASTSLWRSRVLLHPFCQHRSKQMHSYRDALRFLLVAAGVWLSASL